MRVHVCAYSCVHHKQLLFADVPHVVSPAADTVLPLLMCVCRVGQKRIYTYIYTVYLVISKPKIPYVNRIYMVLANPTCMQTDKGVLHALPSYHP